MPKRSQTIESNVSNVSEKFLLFFLENEIEDEKKITQISENDVNFKNAIEQKLIEKDPNNNHHHNNNGFSLTAKGENIASKIWIKTILQNPVFTIENQRNILIVVEKLRCIEIFHIENEKDLLKWSEKFHIEIQSETLNEDIFQLHQEELITSSLSSWISITKKGIIISRLIALGFSSSSSSSPPLVQLIMTHHNNHHNNPLSLSSQSASESIGEIISNTPHHSPNFHMSIDSVHIKFNLQLMMERANALIIHSDSPKKNHWFP